MKIFKIKLTSLFLILFFLFLLKTGYSQNTISRFSYQQYIENRDTLLYRQLFPDYDTLRKYPLIIFLHGAGERGDDNEAQLKWSVQNFATDEMMTRYPAIVIAPQCPKNSSWASFRNNGSTSIPQAANPTKPMELVLGLIHQMMKNRLVDTNRIYITGLSMGGFGTYDAIERYPNLFAAAVPVCGGGDISKASAIAHIPMWIFHGAEDATVNPEYSVSMVEALRKAGAHPGFTMYPETGHFSWLAAYSDPLMIAWLFRQHK